MTTQEFFQIAFDHLDADGVLTVNVGRSPNDRRLIDGLATTIATVFPSVYVMDIPGTLNSMIYATRQPTKAENLSLNLSALQKRGDVHPLLIRAVETALVNLQPGYQTTLVFTDDKAPIEWITNRMIINFVLHGDTEILTHE
jgi:spermidine synthase